MIVKQSLAVATVAACLTFSLAGEAQAGDIGSYEDYRLYCSPLAFRHQVQSSECHLYQKVYENRLQQELKQPIRRRSTRRQNEDSDSGDRKFYLGASLGVGFPTGDIELIREGVANGEIENFAQDLGFDVSADEVRDLFTIDLDAGFAGSFFLGTKFNRNFALDLEVAGFGGGTDTDDVNYSQGGLFLNPRFELPLSESKNSLAVFLSPGIGIAQGRLSLEIPDEAAEDLGINDDQTISLEDDLSFAWQAKAGLSYPFGNRYSGFSQLRYFGSTGDNTTDLLSAEAGITVSF